MRIILFFRFTCRNLLVKSPLGDVSEKPMMGMIYPFSAGTLTFVRTIETFVESLCHRTRTIHSSRSFHFFWWGWLGWVASSSHLINKLNKANLKRSKSCYLNLRQALKTFLSRISVTGELHTWLCLNGRNYCYFIRNVCLSRCRKANSISFRSCIRTLVSLNHLVAQKPDRTTAIQSVYNVSRTKARLQNVVTTKPPVEMSRMSNQQKVEFVGNIFHRWSF
jgi:hypothetical protein